MRSLSIQNTRHIVDKIFMTKEALSTELIDRKVAGKLLKMSIRTIDRYRHSGQLTTTILDNKIFLKKSEIDDFISRHSRHKKTTYVSTEDTVDTVDKNMDTEDTRENIKSRERTIRSHHEHEINLTDYYKKMYEDLMTELRQRESGLQAANYRIGKLEGQVRYSVPLIEYQQEKRQLLTEGSKYRELAITEKKLREQSESQMKKAYKNFLIERLNKRIYLAIVLALILLQPLWLFLVQKP